MRRIILAIAPVASVLTLAATAAASSKCYKAYPQDLSFPADLQVTVWHRDISCQQSQKVARLVWHRYTTPPYIPLQDYPPPPLGAPGGQSKPFTVKPHFGTFTCHMMERGSDFIQAICDRGNKSATIYDHLNDL